MEGFNLIIILLPRLLLFSSMDFKHKIIQWNCRGLKPNYNDVSLLISEYNPSVFCFQETFLKPDDNISLKGFNIYNYVHTDCLRPSGGASIFVKSSFPQRKIDLQTNLQATAISVTLDREITICSVYIPPSFSLNSQQLDNLLQQLPSPYIILGDFNGHNILWGGQNNDSRGKLIENFITKNDICIIMISLILIILQVQSILHLLIFPSVIHHCFLIIIGLYVKTNTIVITFLSSLNRTLFPLRITIQSGN